MSANKLPFNFFKGKCTPFTDRDGYKETNKEMFLLLYSCETFISLYCLIPKKNVGVKKTEPYAVCLCSFLLPGQFAIDSAYSIKLHKVVILTLPYFKLNLTVANPLLSR